MRRRGVTRDRVTHRGKALRIVEARSFHEGVSQTVLAAPDEAVRAKAPALLGWGGDRSVRGYGPSSAANRRENLPPSHTTKDPPKRKGRRETPLPLTAVGQPTDAIRNPRDAGARSRVMGSRSRSDASARHALGKSQGDSSEKILVALARRMSSYR